MKLDIKEQLDDILSQYSGERSDLLPILQQAQERFSYLPLAAMPRIAKFLRLSESTVYGVATFYDRFRLTPEGKKTVKVCQGPACHVQGGRQVLQEMEKRLGIKPGQTTDDHEYSLETTACSGSCALAPVTEIGKVVYGQMTSAKVGQVLGTK